jgi:putative peptide zinc metalloprotease protein
LLAIQTTCDRLSAQLDSLRQQRSSSGQRSSQIPVVQQELADARTRKRLHEAVADRLRVKSPRGGRLFAPPPVLPQADDDRLARFWTGTPLDPINRGAWLAKGTVLCMIGDPSTREAVVMMQQQEIEAIREGQVVTLLLADRRRGSVTGRVLEVATTPHDTIPVELQRTGLIQPPPPGAASQPYYQVRVLLDPSATTLPIRLTGHARITVSSESIFKRVHRFLSDSFG